MNGQKIVKIIWRDISGIDSADNSSSWFTKEQMAAEAQKLYDAVYTTVGEIVFENDLYVAIAATRSHDEKTPLFSDASMIPKSVIIKIEEI